MNRTEAIKKSAQLFLQVLEHNDNRLTDAVYESINNLREALAMPKDAERVALRDAMKRNDLIGRIDEVGDGENLEILLRDIRDYLQGGA
jgi:hypothetical protein